MIRDMEYEDWLEMVQAQNMPPDEAGQMVVDAVRRMERGSWRRVKELLGVDDEAR